jgi:hypothetical protein
MRVLIRDEKTGRYFGEAGDWVTEAKEALGFPTLHAAGKKAREHEACDVVLSYEDPACELAINPVYCVQRSLPTQSFFFRPAS